MQSISDRRRKDILINALKYYLREQYESTGWDELSQH